MQNQPPSLLLRCALLLLVLFSLSGCADNFIAPYGFVAADREKVSGDRAHIQMPSNAPSISQGYKPEAKPIMKERGDGFHIEVKRTSQRDEEKKTDNHNGIDIIAKSGTPVLAVADGVVTDSYFEPFYGNRIVLAHGRDDNGLFMKSKYFHLQERLVKQGEQVRRGQQIGRLGRTGILSAGMQHLHFELRGGASENQRLAEPLHPHNFWADGAGVVTCFDKHRSYPTSPFKTTYPVPCRGVDWQ